VRERGARDGADPSVLRAAVEAQRKSVQRVVEAASACWQRAGIASSSDHQRKLLATVQAWLAGSGDEQPGRMSHDLDPPGFDAIGAVGLAVARAPLAAAAKPPGNERDEHLERAVTELAGRERAVQAARERARNQHTQEERAVTHQQHAVDELRRAEAALATARAQLEERSAALERARAERVDADRELARAEQELASAQGAVNELRTGAGKRRR
jgi:hypothetical protein